MITVIFLGTQLHVLHFHVDHNINLFRLMQTILSSIHCNDLVDPLKRLALERHRIQKEKMHDQKSITFISQSIYRDILFLTCKALGRANIDLNAFDKEYTTAFARIPERNKDLYAPNDRPMTVCSIYCRQYFKPLSLP